MTTDFTGAAADAASKAERAASGPQDAFLEKLAERVGGKASIKAVFGEPISRNGKTIVPVAKIRWGFGGGTGTGPSSQAADAPVGTGTGAGGGVTAEPIGYLEIGDEGAAFKPIAAAYPSPVFLLAAGFAGSLVIRAIARLIRG
jgi:uncharacterized spore protein YtfJ